MAIFIGSFFPTNLFIFYIPKRKNGAITDEAPFEMYNLRKRMRCLILWVDKPYDHYNNHNEDRPDVIAWVDDNLSTQTD
jgi:hypothetical protein